MSRCGIVFWVVYRDVTVIWGMVYRDIGDWGEGHIEMW